MTQRKTFKVCRKGLGEALAHLPLLTDFPNGPHDFDAFIGACGFEERVLGLPRHLSSLAASIAGPIILGRYRTNLEDNSQREQELLPQLQLLGSDLHFFDADSPEATRRTIASCFEQSGDDPKRVLFDISGASSTLIFSVIASLSRMAGKVNLTIGYTSAVHYHNPGSETQSIPMVQWPESHLRETGVSDVVTNELYRGIHHDHLPGFVVALPSMYTARLQRCLSHLGVGPFSGATGNGNVYWIFPTTSDEEHRWRQEVIKGAVVSLMHESPSNADEPSRDIRPDAYTYCDIWDYISCLRHVVEQIDRQEGANSSIIHMGTKIQAIGVALAALGRPEVSIVSARPSAFSARTYSDGIGQMHRLDIEDLQMLIRVIASVGTLEVESTNL